MTRVKRRDGGVFPDLFAVGDAACRGGSGSGGAGYLSVNRLPSKPKIEPLTIYPVIPSLGP